jgi:hypothetical protein
MLIAPRQSRMDHAQRKRESESVSYVVCTRNGVRWESETYLANFVAKNTSIDDIDLCQVMPAAGQVESLLGLAGHTRYNAPKSRG